MTEEQINIGRLLGVDPERVHLRNKSVRLGGITREEFTGLVTKFEGTDYRLSMLKPGERLFMGCGKDDTFEALFALYQKGLDVETIRAIMEGYEGELPAYMWDLLAGGSAA